MKAIVAAAALVSMVAVPNVLPDAASARERHYRGDGHTYHGRDRNYRYRYRCKRSSGTTGLIAGGAGGALIANALGAGTVGTIAGGVGGALLGKHLDKRHDRAQNRRNGC